MRVLCVIPVFNEENHLHGTLKSISSNHYGVDKFLFVNNGSTDDSKKIIENTDYELINLSKNFGIGYVLIEGIKYCIENNYDVLTVIHGGNKMDTRDFETILKPILKNDYDCIWGSRFLENTSHNMPAFRKKFSPVLSKIVSLFYKKSITDATNGFRAYRLDLLLEILPNYDRKWLYGYAFESFLFGKMLNATSCKSKEVPVTITYNSEIKNTKIRPILDYPAIVLPYFLARFIK